MSIAYDFHLHSAFSGDSETPSRQMIERALALGLDGLCFTEHEDPYAPDSEIDFSIDFERYFPYLQKLRAEYQNQIWIGIGMEFGIQPHLAGQLDLLTKTYDFDFVIASLHFVGGKDPYFPSFYEGREERDCYIQFFEEELAALKCFKNFDTLGHLDYVVRYGPNRNRFYSYKAYAEYLDPILKYLIENGKCLEINTGGLKYGLGQPNPCSDVLKRYRELGGEEITIGSDAHAPQHLCFDFDKAEQLLKELGFRYYTIFKQRIPKHIPIR